MRRAAARGTRALKAARVAGQRYAEPYPYERSLSSRGVAVLQAPMQLGPRTEGHDRCAAVVLAGPAHAHARFGLHPHLRSGSLIVTRRTHTDGDGTMGSATTNQPCAWGLASLVPTRG